MQLRTCTFLSAGLYVAALLQVASACAPPTREGEGEGEGDASIGSSAYVDTVYANTRFVAVLTTDYESPCEHLGASLAEEAAGICYPTDESCFQGIRDVEDAQLPDTASGQLLIWLEDEGVPAERSGDREIAAEPSTSEAWLTLGTRDEHLFSTWSSEIGVDFNSYYYRFSNEVHVGALHFEISDDLLTAELTGNDAFATHVVATRCAAVEVALATFNELGMSYGWSVF